MSEQLVNDNFMEEAAKQVQDDVQADEVMENLDEMELGETDIELPESSFFENEGQSEEVAESTEQNLDEESSIPQETETAYKYKANGEEFDVDFSSEEVRQEILKKLSLADGARKVFSDKAKLQRRLKQFETKMKDNEQKVKYWDELNKIHESDDKAMMWKALTGQDFDEMVQKEVQKSQLRMEATPEQLQLIEREEEFERMQARMQRMENESKTRADKITKERAESQQKNLQSMLVPEFQKYTGEFEDHTPATQNRLKKMLWKSTIDDLIEYGEQGYDVSNPKIFRKVMANNAKALNVFRKKGVEAKTNQILENRKQVAKESAQVASTRNYPNGQIDPKWNTLDPKTLFDKMFKK